MAQEQGPLTATQLARRSEQRWATEALLFVGITNFFICLVGLAATGWVGYIPLSLSLTLIAHFLAFYADRYKNLSPKYKIAATVVMGIALLAAIAIIPLSLAKGVLPEWLFTALGWGGLLLFCTVAIAHAIHIYNQPDHLAGQQAIAREDFQQISQHRYQIIRYLTLSVAILILMGAVLLIKTTAIPVTSLVFMTSSFLCIGMIGLSVFLYGYQTRRENFSYNHTRNLAITISISAAFVLTNLCLALATVELPSALSLVLGWGSVFLFGCATINIYYSTSIGEADSVPLLADDAALALPVPAAADNINQNNGLELPSLAAIPVSASAGADPRLMAAPLRRDAESDIAPSAMNQHFDSPASDANLLEHEEVRCV